MGNEIHIPVLLQEVADCLRPKKGDVYIDATAGFGGHLELILTRIGQEGRALAIDQDADAISYLTENLLGKWNNLIISSGNFNQLEETLEQKKFPRPNLILADLGVSSAQFDNVERGFSFKSGPLDMRMDYGQLLSAATVVNDYSESELIRVFQDYGEERFSKTIAQRIVQERKQKSFEYTNELAELVSTVYRRKGLRTRLHPATKVFQAIRIEVNNEMGSLEAFLDQALKLLETDGRLAVISFHSLEDRLVKRFFIKHSKECICPPEFQNCSCEHKRQLKIITKKPIVPSENEVKENPRARSAKLRVAQKI